MISFNEWLYRNPGLRDELLAIFAELEENMEDMPEDIEEIIEENKEELYL